MDLPKPQFPYIGRFYEAIIKEGLRPGSLNKENADTVMRKLSRTTWLENNKDLHQLWLLGGDGWGDIIKSVKSYSTVVNQSKRNNKKTQNG